MHKFMFCVTQQAAYTNALYFTMTSLRMEVLHCWSAGHRGVSRFMIIFKRTNFNKSVWDTKLL